MIRKERLPIGLQRTLILMLFWMLLLGVLVQAQPCSNPISPPQIQTENTLICATDPKAVFELSLPEGDQVRMYTQETGGSPVAVDSLLPFNFTVQHLTASTTFWFEAWDSRAGCASARVGQALTLHQLPVQFDPLPDTLCMSSAAQSLQATPPGGFFSGPGVTGSSFSPADADVGTHTLTYTVRDQGCEFRQQQTVTVISHREAAMTDLPEVMCTNQAPVTLEGFPGEGTFTGPGVSGSTFDPALAQPGLHIVEYNTFVNGCFYAAADTVLVQSSQQPPQDMMMRPQLCLNSPPELLDAYAQGMPGSFSGTGVSGNYFDPAVAGVGQHRIEFRTSGEGGDACEMIFYDTVTVVDSYPVEIQGLEPAYCAGGEQLVTLSSNVPGGVFSGPGVSGNTFNPALVSTGVHTIRYQPGGAGTVDDPALACADFPEVQVEILPTPAVPSVADVQICSAGPAQLDVVMGQTAGSQAVLFTVPAGGNPVDVASSAPFTLTTPTVATQTTFYVEAQEVRGATLCASPRVPVVVQVEAIQAEIQNLDTRYCAGDNQTVMLYGEPSSGAYSGPGIVGNVFDPSQAGVGTHVITYLGTEQGCSFSTTQTVEVVQPDGPRDFIAETSICETGTLLNLATGLGGTFSGPGVTGTDFMPAQAGLGSHVITWTTEIDGCPFSVQDTVEVIGSQTTDRGNRPEVCVTSPSFPLDALGTGSGTYAGAGVTGKVFDPRLAGIGTHYVSYSEDRAGCTEVVYDSIRVVTGPSATISGLNSTYCTGASSVSLTGTPAGGLFTGPGVTGSFFNPSALTAGTYTLRYTGTVNGCDYSTEQTVTITAGVPSTIQVQADGPSCGNTPVTLTADSVAGAQYQWYGPNGFSAQTNPVVLPSVTTAEAGSYIVVVSVPGCSGTVVGVTQVSTSQQSAPVTAGNDGPVCTGGTLHLTATSLSGATYQWFGPNGFQASTAVCTLANVTAAQAGTYIVLVQQGNCPQQVALTTVSITQAPNSQARHNGPLCSGATLQLTADPVPGATYAWAGPNGFTSSVQNPVIPNAGSLQSGPYSLSVSVPGCPSVMDTAAVMIHETPSAQLITTDQTICAGDSVQIELELRGTGPWTLAMSDSQLNNQTFTLGSSASPSPAVLTLALAPTTSTTYTLNAVSDAGGCSQQLSDSISVQVAAQSTPPTVVQNGPLCVGDTLQLNTQPAPANATYQWFGPNGFYTQQAAPQVPNVKTQDAGTYIALVTVGSCPPAVAFGTVSVNAGVDSVTASNNGPLCPGQTLNLTASPIPGATYLWTGPNGYTASAVAPALASFGTAQAGTYSVVAISGNCTSAVATTTVDLNPLPSASINGNVIFGCTGQTVDVPVQLTGTGPWTLDYTVNNAPMTVTNITSSPHTLQVTPSTPGLTTVGLTGVSSDAGCTGTASGSTFIVASEPPTLNVVNTQAAGCAGDQGQIEVQAQGGSGSGYAYSLDGVNFSNTTGRFTNLAAGTYTVTVRDGDCTDTVQVTLEGAQPTVLTGVQPGPETLSVSWDAVPGADEYILGYRMSGSNSPWMEINGLNQATHTLSNLNPGTTYELAVRVVCAGGDTSAWSNTLTGTPTAVQVVCDAPARVRYADLTTNSAVIQWDAPASSATCYIVSYGSLLTPTSTWTEQLVPAPMTSLQLTGLNASTPYGFRVRSNCSSCSLTGGNPSNWSTTGGFYTPAPRQATESVGPSAAALRVYPNPNRGTFRLLLPEANAAGLDLNSTLTLIDLTGLEVFSQPFQTREQELPVTLPDQLRGLFILKVEHGGRTHHLRLRVE